MHGRSISAKGSQTQIVIETQGMFFSPDNLMALLKNNEFQIMQGNVSNPLNPGSQPVFSQLFSKGPLMISMQQSPPTTIYLILVIMNVLDLSKEKIGEKSGIDLINEILDGLNLTEETITSITFTFTTRFQPATGSPADLITNLINKDFIDRTKNSIKLDTMKAFSIRLGDRFPIEKEGTNLVFEPLINEPEKIFLMQFIRKLKSREGLTELFKNFPEMLPSIMNGVDPID